MRAGIIARAWRVVASCGWPLKLTVRHHFVPMLDPSQILAGARSTVNFDPRDFIRELEAFGESEAAEKFLHLDGTSIAAIGVLASRHYSAADRPFLDKAICRGIVEFLEGRARPLRRARRKYPEASDGSDA